MSEPLYTIPAETITQFCTSDSKHSITGLGTFRKTTFGTFYCTICGKLFKQKHHGEQKKSSEE